MYTKPIERIVRMFMAQKLDRDYIRHYLEEEFQLDRKTCDQVFERVGLAGPTPGPGGKPAAGDGGKIKKQDFF